MPLWANYLVANLQQLIIPPLRQTLIPLLAGGLAFLGALDSLPDNEIIRLLDSLPDILIFYLLYRQPDPKRYQIIESKLDRIMERLDRRKPRLDELIE